MQGKSILGLHWTPSVLFLGRNPMQQKREILVIQGGISVGNTEVRRYKGLTTKGCK